MYDVVLSVRGWSRRGESQPCWLLTVGRRQLVIVGRLWREVVVGVRQNRADVRIKTCFGGQVRVSTVGREPVQAPLERTHDPPGRRHRGETSFPGVKKGCEHR